MTFLRRHRVSILIYLVSLAAFLAASGGRLRKPSTDNHYVWLADAMLHGRLALDRKPPHENDWARVETVELRDGRTLRGATLRTAPDRFRTQSGHVVTVRDEDVKRRDFRYYVSFPPFPALLLLPFVALFRFRTNDVLFTVVLAALNPVLIHALLARLRPRSGRGESDNLWLTLLFAFGTVNFYASVLGQVWYTAHVVGVALACLFLLAALDARRPLAAGLCVGLGFVTRTPLLFLFPFFVFEAWRVVRDFRDLARRLALFAAPVAAIGLAMAWANYARFGDPFEFGHYYLNVKWTERIQRWGLFNVHFLSRNLAAALVLLPKFLAKYPWVKVSWHGLSLLLTTPVFAYLLWPRRKGPLHGSLWLTVAAVAVPSLLYQNSGWVQFGYRFSLDWTPMWIALLALGGRPIGALMKLLILWSVAVNLFGAITFGRYGQFYWDGLLPVG